MDFVIEVLNEYGFTATDFVYEPEASLLEEV